MDVMHKQFELVFVLLLATTYTATSFLLWLDHCIAPPPCICRDTMVYCNSRSLTDVPHLAPVTKEYSPKLYINLYNNTIYTIPAKVFKNVFSVNTTSISFNFDNNMISIIDPLAFSGVENTTQKLLLRNNQLSRVPSAIGNLEGLYLEGNPLVSLDSSVMAHLSSHFTRLVFEMGHFSSSVWPTGLSKLIHLQYLVINFIPLNHLMTDAFAGLGSGLISLTLQFSKLARIPAAVCHLQNLETLNFDNNDRLESNTSIFEHCSHNLTKLTTLTLTNDSLYSFPDVLQYFPTLINLDLGNNKIRFIQTSVIPIGNTLKTLFLNNNSLIKLPFALNKLEQLLKLIMGYNRITTVEDHDLIGLTNLEYLDLQNNPLEYIAPDAFSHNVKLNVLYLSGTKLQLIPEAVKSLTHFYYLTFENNNADCSCKMFYLKGWNVTQIAIDGKCAYQPNQEIKQFLVADLPNCP